MNIEHLRCAQCESAPTIARIDGEVKIVCHCTHIDGSLEWVDPADVVSDQRSNLGVGLDKRQEEAIEAFEDLQLPEPWEYK